MKTRLYSSNRAFFLPILAGLCATFFISVGTVQAQNLNFNTITGYTMSVNPGPTICETSSSSVTTFYYPIFFGVPDAPASTLTASEGTHHMATAGETTIVTLDIPAAGYLAQNWQLLYKYGEPGDVMNLQVLQQPENPPPGVLHFDIPVTFAKA